MKKDKSSCFFDFQNTNGIFVTPQNYSGSELFSPSNFIFFTIILIHTTESCSL